MNEFRYLTKKMKVQDLKIPFERLAGSNLIFFSFLEIEEKMTKEINSAHKKKCDIVNAQGYKYFFLEEVTFFISSLCLPF